MYDYACQTCGHQVEVIHGVHEAGPSICPRCGGPMRKMVSAPAIHFKGSGWAKKDARDARSRPATSAADGGQKESKAKDADSGAVAKSTTDGTAKADSRPPENSTGSQAGVKPDAAD
jgi:putative FmdB family regulatory protein